MGSKARQFLFVAVIAFACMHLSRCASTNAPSPPPAPTGGAVEERVLTEETWGVQVLPVRLTGAGYFLDVRLHVIDPEKAAALLKGVGEGEALIIHEKTGTKMTVPATKIGPLRAKTEEPKENRNYVFLFANANKIIQPGDAVTLIIGNLRAEGLNVE